MAGVQTVRVKQDEADWRLDKWFKVHYPDLTYGRLSKLLRTGQIRVDGKRVKANVRLHPDNEVRVPPLGEAPDAPRSDYVPVITPEDVRYARQMIIYEDDDVVVLNKPPGLAVQGGTKIAKHVDGLLPAFEKKDQGRPKLVHRLDKDTSGILVIARNAQAAKKLTAAFRERTTRKIYWALVVGRPELESGQVRAPLDKEEGSKGERMMVSDDGKPAHTLFHVMDHAYDKASWLVMMPLTGRTHQLRVHAKVMGTPIVGDGKYGGQDAFLQGAVSRKLHLHARHLEIPHPKGGILSVTAELPNHMLDSWNMFGFDPKDKTDPFLDET